MRDVALGVAHGKIEPSAAADAGVAQDLRSIADAVAFARRCWEEADSAVAGIGNAQLSGIVNGWGLSLPGSVCMRVLNDELVHHRGQL